MISELRELIVYEEAQYAATSLVFQDIRSCLFADTRPEADGTRLRLNRLHATAFSAQRLGPLDGRSISPRVSRSRTQV
jgi:hypothetical protein